VYSFNNLKDICSIVLVIEKSNNMEGRTTLPMEFELNDPAPSRVIEKRGT
jgi:hypothetical protein